MTATVEPESPPATNVALCDHCGLPVPRGLVNPDAEHQFCCSGCATVFETLRACGLEGYYGLRARLEVETTPAQVRHAPYIELDDPAFAERYVQRHADGTAACDLILESVHCAACVWLLERLPRVVDGVVEARLSLRDRRLRVVWRPEAVALSKIARSLDRLGYPPHPARDGAQEAARRAEDRRELRTHRGGRRVRR